MRNAIEWSRMRHVVFAVGIFIILVPIFTDMCEGWEVSIYFNINQEMWELFVLIWIPISIYMMGMLAYFTGHLAEAFKYFPGFTHIAIVLITLNLEGVDWLEKHSQKYLPVTN